MAKLSVREVEETVYVDCDFDNADIPTVQQVRDAFIKALTEDARRPETAPENPPPLIDDGAATGD